MATMAISLATSDYEGPELGSMAPMREEVVIRDLVVEGTIPERFRGTFYRNGPNPRFRPVGRYHMFDGDGMIHAISFADDGVHYANRWVRTKRWEKEDAEGRALFGGLADRMATDPLVSDWAPAQRSNGNTHTFKHHGKLLALYEGGMPWIIDPKTLETIGLEDYQARLSVAALTAHPHTDPENGDLIAFGTNGDPRLPGMAAIVIDKNNDITLDLPLDPPFQSFIHDSVFTKDYILLPLHPLTRDPGRMARGEPYIKWEPHLGARLGILPRNARSGDEARWIRMDTCSFFHFFNAYQSDDNTIVIDACGDDDASATVGGSSEELGRMERWTVDLRAGTVERRRLFDEPMDFPRIDERLQGRRHTLGIAVGNAGGGPTIEMNIVYCCRPDELRLDRRVLPPGQICSEAVFVPADPLGELEKGYVATLVLDHDSMTSHILILDADDIAGPPIAKVYIPKRIPNGFHANWVSDLPGYPQGDF